MSYTIAEKIAEVEREIAMRQGVYKRQVGYRRMTQQEADRRIGIMQEILADYVLLLVQEKVKGLPRSVR